VPAKASNGVLGSEAQGQPGLRLESFMDVYIYIYIQVCSAPACSMHHARAPSNPLSPSAPMHAVLIAPPASPKQAKIPNNVFPQKGKKAPKNPKPDPPHQGHKSIHRNAI